MDLKNVSPQAAQVRVQQNKLQVMEFQDKLNA